MPLSNLDLEAIKTEAAEHQHSETQHTGQSAVLWKSRLDVVLAPPKDGEAVSEHVMQDLGPPPWKDRKCK